MLACGSSTHDGDSPNPSDRPEPSNGSDDKDGDGDDSSGPSDGDFTDAATTPEDDGCNGLGRSIFVLDRDTNKSPTNETTTRMRLRRFDPKTSTMTTIGPVTCPIPPAGRLYGIYGTMAIDRTGQAFVTIAYGNGKDVRSGEAFRIDTKDGSCTSTGVTTLQITDESPPRIVLAFGGWTFSSRSKGNKEDVLFGITWGSQPPPVKLVTFDPKTLAKSDVASIPPSGTHLSYGSTTVSMEPSLLGTSDARLLALRYSGSQFELSEVDRTNATSKKIADVPVPPSEFINSSSVMWGGDIWWMSPTGVFRYKLSSDKSSQSAWTSSDPEDSSFYLSVAGTSTCAPYAPVN